MYSIYIGVYNKLFGTYVDWYTPGTMEHIAQIKMRGNFFFAIAFESHSLYTGCIVQQFHGIVNSYRKMNLKNTSDGNNAKPVQLVLNKRVLFQSICRWKKPYLLLSAHELRNIYFLTLSSVNPHLVCGFDFLEIFVSLAHCGHATTIKAEFSVYKLVRQAFHLCVGCGINIALLLLMWLNPNWIFVKRDGKNHQRKFKFRWIFEWMCIVQFALCSAHAAFANQCIFSQKKHANFQMWHREQATVCTLKNVS